ncbi:MAG: hypothetical protein PQJ61_03370 [Spirochaetales bacterium]|uniref:Dystroglycan-type cadherin-like domain-containing protein n=1 Tax=Candidatus Thalassospirochaeta sargassi TaxID=3119039 RepID=A0AAJ1IDG9_9SPIO|nr:hypothetical protein [Spirochaetales bacterium]
MKKCVFHVLPFFLAAIAGLVFFSCTNQMNPSVLDPVLTDTIDDTTETDLDVHEVEDPAETVITPYVFEDSDSGGAVFVDSKGLAIPIQNEEESGNVVCSEVIEFISFDTEETVSRCSSCSVSVAAIILGKRNDGYSGIWIIYSNGRIAPVVNSEDFDTSELLEMVEGRQSLSGYFNWSYNATDMVVNDDASEIIIIGYAENSGFESSNYIVEEGTTVGVYWSVILDDDGFYHISRAKVIGLRDFSSWRDYFKEYRKYRRNGYNRYHHRWMWVLRMFFAGWYDQYLVLPGGIEAGENDGEYTVYGTDQANEKAVAVITAKKVLSIEPYEGSGDDPSDNQAPYDITGPSEVNLEYRYDEPYYITLETSAPGAALDPDEGDTVKFYSSTLPEGAVLDADTGILSYDTLIYDNYSVEITVWTEDNHGLKSADFVITIYIDIPS